MLLADLRYAVRTLRRSPGFAAVAILTLALGIGANTAIFSVIDAVLLKPLPYRAPNQLVQLWETESAPGNYPFAGPDFIAWKTQNHTFSDMALYSWGEIASLGGGSRPASVVNIQTEGNFFALLGAHALLGRTWRPGEDEPGHDHVAILSYGLWNDQFAADRGIVGRNVRINAQTYAVVGVMPRGFNFPQDTQLWTPLDMDGKTLRTRGSHWARAIGRMKPGVTLGQAQAEMTVIASRLEHSYPDSNYKVGASLVGLHDQLVGNSRTSLWMMLWAVALVLLIACANVANLLLARAAARQKEMAVRSALGAGRGRLIRQLLTESVLLAIAGGVLGVGLAEIGVASLASLKQFAVPQPNPIQMDGRVLAFALALAVFTGIVFGLAPAWHLSRPDMYDELKGGAGSTLSPSRHRRRLSDALVVAEVGLSLVLLIAAGLLIESFVRLQRAPVGVRAKGVLTAAIALPDTKYKDAAVTPFYEALLQRLQRAPGVESAALVSQLPLNGGSNGYVQIQGRPVQQMSGRLVESTDVSAGYFHAMGIPLLRGRIFSAADFAATQAIVANYAKNAWPSPAARAAASYPVVINQTMVKDFWPHDDPIGRRFCQCGDSKGPWAQVIGVVGDVKQSNVATAAMPEEYSLFSPFDGYMNVVLHTSLPADSLVGELRTAVAGLDPDLAVAHVRTMRQLIEENSASTQVVSLLLGLFAGLALLLAAVGIYGVMSYLVTQRTREIGIRLSLGAPRGRVLGMVLGHGLRLALIGGVLGVVGALAAGRLLARLLYGVRPGNVGTIAVTVIVLGAVALLACYLPARRAARVDPMVALRYE